MSDFERVQKGMVGYSRLVGKDYSYFREKGIFNFQFANFQLNNGVFFWLGPKESKAQDLISFLTLRQSPKS